jgi:hypothetical protein
MATISGAGRRRTKEELLGEIIFITSFWVMEASSKISSSGLGSFISLIVHATSFRPAVSPYSSQSMQAER